MTTVLAKLRWACAFIWLFTASFHAQASLDSGFAWLGNQQGVEGEISIVTDLTYAQQSTFESLALLELAGEPAGVDRSQAVQFLSSSAFLNTEFLSQLILLGQTQNTEGDSYLELLFARQNFDGGFGDGENYQSTAYDTAWALAALGKEGAQSQEVSAGLAYLVNTQEPDGSWLLNDVSTLHVTALVAKTLGNYRYIYPATDTAYQSAIQVLLENKDGNSLWGEDFVSGRVLEAILPSLTDLASIQSSVDALSVKQLNDGSWAGDVYTTAIVLRVLHRIDNNDFNPALGSITATVIDGVNNVPLSGVTVALSGNMSQSVLTGADGTLSFANLEPGQYQLAITQTGYQSMEWTGMLNVGQDRDLGNLYLIEVTSPEEPTTGIIQGRVTEFGTGNPLVGVVVKISGTSVEAVTNLSGEYLLLNVPAQTATVRFTKDGYAGALSTFDVVAGNTYWLSPVLKPEEPEEPLPSLLSGVVTDAESGLPISGASIILTGANSQSVTTSADGSYSIENLSVGPTSVSMTAPGYHGATASLDVQSGNSYNLSPALVLVTEPEPEPEQPTSLIGKVVDATNDEPLAGISVTFDIDDESFIAVTNAEGEFEIIPGIVGEGLMLFMGSGYQSTLLSINLQEGFVNDVGTISLQPDGAATLFSFSGVVVDSLSSEPIAGVAIDVEAGTQLFTLTTDSNGQFAYSDLEINTLSMSLFADDYIASSFSAYFDESFTDIGTIRLKPADAPEFNPDLVVRHVDNTSTHTDPVTLALTGQAVVTVENLGVKPAEGSWSVQVFYDVNLNGAFDTGDLALGTNSFDGSVLNAQQIEIVVDVSGDVPYRDVPMTAWVDIENNIVETNEANNIASTAAFCDIELAISGSELDHRIMWHWDGTPEFPNQRRTMGPFVVGQLTDDNNDGLVNLNDSPDIAFIATGSQLGNNGVLTIVDGATGETHWQRNRFKSTNHTVLALGDIDDDGIAELISVENSGRDIVAWNHDGTILWEKQHGALLDSVASLAVSLADIDHDGDVEISIGRAMLDHEGNILWKGTGLRGAPRGNSWGAVSIVADVIEESFGMEVIAGSTIYSSTGEILLDFANTTRFGDGVNAIGNFDDDDQAEIVLNNGGRVYLVNHDGSLIWGPVTTGGNGGPPTVADFDGDGMPEIGVAGSRYYSVVDGDGVMLWQVEVSDFSSSATGSSVFDFEADGNSEVVYADEKDLWIFDGKTGEVRLDIESHTSITRIELPVIADIDGDGFAEIIFGSNGTATTSTRGRGVRALEAAEGNWAPTRAIWNQHAYHVNNVNDDGSIPQYEEPSWLTHNTYRLNTFADGGVLDAFDLTLSQLELMDNGTGQPFTLKALIGNSGKKTSPASQVDFYLGLPDQGGTIIGSSVLPELVLDQSVTVSLNNVEGVADGDVIYAVVNPFNQIKECRADNNTQTILASAVIGDVSLTLNLSAAVINDILVADSIVQNTGVFVSDYNLIWAVEDTFGNVIATFSDQYIDDLGSAATVTFTEDWNVGNTAAGNYVVHAELYDLTSKLLDEAYAPFEILRSDDDGEVTYNTSINSDKQEYLPYDDVHLLSRIRNLALNASQEALVAQVRVMDSDGTEVFARDIAVPELAATAIADYNDTLALVDALVGTYTATITLFNADLSELLATDNTAFDVVDDPLAHLTGSVSVAHPVVERGDTQSCTDTVKNRSSNTEVTATITKLLVAVDDETAITSDASTETFVANAVAISGRNISTSGLQEGGYACVLQATANGVTSTLGFASFQVTVPPIKLETTAEVGGRGRLLILLDDLLLHDSTDNTTIADQDTYLRELLDSEGWSYTITYNADDFTREFYTGQYIAYALMSNRETLSPQVEEVLAEAVNTGEGLLISGAFNRRNNKIEKAMGVGITGQEHKSAEVVLPAGSLSEDWPETTLTPSRMHDIDRCEADSIAYFTGTKKNGKGQKPHSACTGDTDVEAAIASHAYGEGYSVFVAFDALDEATHEGGLNNAYAEILKYNFDAIHPKGEDGNLVVPLTQGNAVPVQLTVENLGIEVGVRLRIEETSSITFIEGHGWTLVEENGVTFVEFSALLAEDTVLQTTIYLQLRANQLTVVPLLIESSTDEGQSWVLYEEQTISLDVVPATASITDLDAALNDLLVTNSGNKNLQHARGHLDEALTAHSLGDTTEVVHQLLKAANYLEAEVGEGNEQAVALRLMLDSVVLALVFTLSV